MLQVEIKINGNLICHIHGENIGQVLPIEPDMFEYKIKAYDISRARVVKFDIVHKGSTGMWPLLEKISAEAYRRLK